MPYHIEPKDSPLSTPEKLAGIPVHRHVGRPFLRVLPFRAPSARNHARVPSVAARYHPPRCGCRIRHRRRRLGMDRNHARPLPSEGVSVPRHQAATPSIWSMRGGIREQEAAEPSLYGTFDSNINNMALNFETGQGGIGSGIKSFLAKIYKYQEGDQMPGEKVTREGGWGDYIPGVMAGDKESAEKQAAEGNDAPCKSSSRTRAACKEPQGERRRHARPQRPRATRKNMPTRLSSMTDRPQRSKKRRRTAVTKAILVNYDYCTGCHSCEVACKKDSSICRKASSASRYARWARSSTAGTRGSQEHLGMDLHARNHPGVRYVYRAHRRRARCPCACSTAKRGVMYYGEAEELVKKMDGQSRWSLVTVKE